MKIELNIKTANPNYEDIIDIIDSIYLEDVTTDINGYLWWKHKNIVAKKLKTKWVITFKEKE